MRHVTIGVASRAMPHGFGGRLLPIMCGLGMLAMLSANVVVRAQVLDKQKQADITTTYYYRWELLTKHLTYGSPQSGYLFTKFIDRPFWSGAYGAISCPAGHQLYEARWLRRVGNHGLESLIERNCDG